MSRRQAEEELRVSGKGLGVLIFIVIGIIIVAILGFTTSYSVGVSQTAILVDPYSGSITGPFNGPITQFFAKAPWVNQITISTSVQTIVLQGKDNGIFVLSNDNLEIEFDINFRYQISPSHAIDLYKKFPGQNWQDAAIIPHIRAAFRDIVARFPADQIQNVRDQIQVGVEQEIIKNIGNDTSLTNDVNVSSTQITDITLPDAFLKAIQDKLNSQQALLQAQFEAQKTITLAEGQANATIAQARGLAEAQIINAMGIKNATIIQAAGTTQALQSIATSLHLNQTQTSQLVNTFVFMQQLQVLCAETNNPCQNMIMFVGGQNGQIFELPVGTTKTGP